MNRLPRFQLLARGTSVETGYFKIEQRRAYVRSIPRIIESSVDSPTGSLTESPPSSPTSSLRQYPTQSSTFSTDTLIQSLTEASTQPLVECPTEIAVDPVALVQSITRVYPSNEQEIRSLHPALSEHDCVAVYEYPWIPKIWLIPSTGDPTLDSSIRGRVAGRDLHVMPIVDLPQENMRLLDPFPGSPIGPRSHYSKFSDAVRLKLKELFPDSVGVNILICGVMVILFPSKEGVDRALAGRRPETIGGLLCHFDVFRRSVLRVG